MQDLLILRLAVLYFSIHVGERMILESSICQKILATNVTSVKQVSCVQAIVIIKIHFTSKTHVTHVTRVRFLSTMSTDVFFHMINLWKTFIANVTSIWLLTSVHTIMNFKRILLWESLITYITDKNILKLMYRILIFRRFPLFTCMYPIMLFQIPWACEVQTANIALIRLLSRVHMCVSWQSTTLWKFFVAYFTRKRFFTSMGSRMSDKIVSFWKVLATDIAFEFLRSYKWVIILIQPWRCRYLFGHTVVLTVWLWWRTADVRYSRSLPLSGDLVNAALWIKH